VKRHAQQIKAYFHPIEIHKRASRQIVERLRQSADVVIGIHVRRSDYRGWRDGQCFFPIPRYADWMRELAAQSPDRKVAFLVCSDEPRAAEEFPGLIVSFGSGTPIEDLFALAKCDLVFGPPSTFSQWASFYGDVPLFHVHNPDTRLDRERFRVSDFAKVP
jgi:hypothetical protein